MISGLYRHLTLCASLFLAVSVSAQTTDEAKKREASYRYDVSKLDELREQIELFGNELNAAHREANDIRRRQDELAPRGDALKKRFKDIKRRDEEYGRMVDRHDARCPEESDDPDLVASCNSEKAACDRFRAALQADLNSFGLDKDRLFRDATELDGLAEQNEKRQNHARFSLDTLTSARDRFRVHIDQLRSDALDCARAMNDPRATCETVKYLCGNIQFDGEKEGYNAITVDPCQ